MYDVTPPTFIDMVITDIGMIPCTSGESLSILCASYVVIVPVVLRVKDQEAFK